MKHPEDNEGEIRRPEGRARLHRPSTALIGGVLLGISALVLQVRASHETRLAAQASDGATILALAGVRAFAEQTDTRALMEIPLGADSMITKARVFAGDESSGTYAVRVAKVGASAFRLKSTGRLVARGKSMMCSVEVFVQLDAIHQQRQSLGVEQDPLCNGSRHRSAVTRIRNIGT
jgi:hypothetical protein